MVPVILLTGFLGSGKTTLLNRLFRQRPPRRGKLAIIVNELGSVGIDGSLLPDGAAQQVELPGGCLCCSLNVDLETTLLELLEREPEVETIIIETTGIAEPLPISWTLAGDALAGCVRLAAVVTTVDALEHETSRPLSPSVDTQVEYADVLVLTKLDLTEDGDNLAETLRARNPHALIIAGPPSEMATTLWDTLDEPDLECRPRQTRGGATHVHATATEFSAVSAPIEGILDFEDLTSELESLGTEYVRIKGVARVVDGSTGSDEPRLIAFHRVGARVSHEPVSGDPELGVVAIGPGVNQAALAACIQACVIK